MCSSGWACRRRLPCRSGLHRGGVLERPSPVLLPLLRHQLDGLGDAFVGFDAGAAQVVQTPQHVVVPRGRKRELRPVADRSPRRMTASGTCDAPGGTPVPGPARPSPRPWRLWPSRTPGALPGRRSWCGTRSARAPLGLAVPAAVLELLAEEPIEQPIAGLAEVAAQRQNPSVDAGLDLALEERRVTEFRPPGDLVADEAHRRPSSLARRVKPQVPQEQQGVQGGRPASVWRCHHPTCRPAPEGRGAGHPNLRRQPATARRQRPHRARP